MKTPLDTRGSRANDGGSARLGKKQPDGTHAQRIAHSDHADFQPELGMGLLLRSLSSQRSLPGAVQVGSWGGCDSSGRSGGGVWRCKPDVVVAAGGSAEPSPGF
jgi:hypothetical protein